MQRDLLNIDSIQELVIVLAVSSPTPTMYGLATIYALQAMTIDRQQTARRTQGSTKN